MKSQLNSDSRSRRDHHSLGKGVERDQGSRRPSAPGDCCESLLGLLSCDFKEIGGANDIYLEKERAEDEKVGGPSLWLRAGVQAWETAGQTTGTDFKQILLALTFTDSFNLLSKTQSRPVCRAPWCAG